jgi:DnaJ-class molecular chaperone
MLNRVICPHCRGELEQDFVLKATYNHMIIGAPFTTSPRILKGCHCTKCGSVFTFDVAGDCPNCKGTGKYEYTTYVGGIKQHSYKSDCPTCNGTGKIPIKRED